MREYFQQYCEILEKVPTVKLIFILAAEILVQYSVKFTMLALFNVAYIIKVFILGHFLIVCFDELALNGLMDCT